MRGPNFMVCEGLDISGMAVSSDLLLLHHLFRPPSLLLLKPLCITATTTLHTLFTTHSSPPRPSFFCNSSSPAFTLPLTPSPAISHEDEHDFPSEDGLDEEEEEEEENRIEPQSEEIELEIPNEGLETNTSSSSLPTRNKESAAAKIPILTVKEKKELAAYAHSLGKKLKCQQVGKSGVTSSVAASFVENLESNELLKLKIHNNCPGELDDVVKQLEEETGSMAIGQIGRTVILYRPSLTKMKAEEKRIQARKIFIRKRSTQKFTETNKERILRLSNRGRHGSNRV